MIKLKAIMHIWKKNVHDAFFIPENVDIFIFCMDFLVDFFIITALYIIVM